MIEVNDSINPNILIIKSIRDTFDYSYLSTQAEDSIHQCPKYCYRIQKCESILEVSEICQKQSPSCILLDWESAELISEPKIVEREELIQRLDRDFVPVINLIEAKNENAAIAQNPLLNYLIKEALTRELLNFAVDQAIAQTKLKQKLAGSEAKNKTLTQRLHLEQAVNLLLQSIHSSFDLSTIFTAATTGVGKLLKLDRVQISQYLSDQEIWKSLMEYQGNLAIPSVLGLEIPDRNNLVSFRLKQGEVVCINCDAENDCSVNQTLGSEYPGSWLIAPLIVGENIWGAISIVSEDKGRRWQNIEIDLINNISTQMAIAIQQSQFHHNLSIELQNRAQADLVLEERGSLINAIFKCSAVGIVITDATGKFVKTNPCYQEMVGYSEIELEVMKFADFTYPEDLSENYRRFMAVVRGEQNSFSIEKRYRHRNGSELWVRVNCFKIDVPADKPQLFIALIEDISDRKAAEINLEQLNQQLEFKVKQRTSALQSSEANNRAILEAVPDLLLRLRRDGTCLDYIKSRVGEENFMVIKNHISEVLPPDLVQKQLEAMEQAISTGELQIYEHQFHKRGRTVYEEVRVLAINDDEILAIIRDISDRKNAENELYQSQEHLRRSEDILRLTIENTPVGICTFSLEANFLSVNQAICKIFGYSPDEILQESILQLTHPDYQKLTLDSITQLIAGTEKNVRIEKQYIHKNGTIIDAVSRVSSIRDANGNPLHFVASVEDITDQKRTAIALKQQMDRQQFLMNITQQIRQSLNLDRVLTTAVNEVKRLLNCDRVIIFQLFNDGVTKVVKEAIEPSYPAIINRIWLDEHFTKVGFDYYINANTRIVNDVTRDKWASCLSEFMQEAQVKSKIVAPIVQHIKPIQDYNPDRINKWQKGKSQLWGLLIAHSCGELRQWRSEEAELLQQIANQLAIAIQQADLHQQVQNELAVRQKFEQELQHQAAADRLLSEVTTAINESINLDEALNLILKKVQEFLKCDRIQIFQLDANFDGCVIKEEVSRPELAILGTMINDSCFATTNLVEEYLQGKITILPDVLNDPNIAPCYVDLLQKFQIRANIAAPIIHSYQLWGLLLVHQCNSPRVWLASEVNLVKQVAAQIGISAQKEKLYSRLINELSQKRVLLKEIHHRVKNNLQVMSSLLRMQFRKTSPEVKILAEEYQNRIQSMALIHDQLYRSDDLSHIDFHRYISNLTYSLFQCYGTNSELVNFILKVDNILIPLDQSIPLGLIINELVSNALKYAFPKGSGRIELELIKLEHQYRLTVSDNGIGIPVDFDLQNTDSLGMQLVQSLTEQLEGEFTYNGKEGSIFQIDFPIL